MFDKYSEALRQQPEIWRKIQAEHNKLAGGFAKLGNSMDAHLDALQDAKDVQEDSEKSLTHTAALWGGIEKSSASTTKSIISGTTSLLKWSGLLSGIGGLLGYLSVDGMMHLGSSVYGQRKSSMGLGLTVGQQRAFDIAFGPLLGSTQGFLGGINTAVTDYAAQGPLYALGVNPNQSTSQVAVATLQALRGRVAGMSTPMLGRFESAYGLGALGIGVEDLRRLQSMPASQYNQLLGTYRKEQSALDLGAQSTAAWTRFMVRMDVAGAEIENVFVKGLQPLAGPLANLAGGFTSLLKVMMAKNGFIAKDINSIAEWMNKFNGEITKPKFLSGLKNFVDSVATLGDAMNAALHPIKAGEKFGGDLWWAASHLTGWSGIAANHGLVINNPGNLKFAGQPGAVRGPGGFAQFPTMGAGVDAIARQFELYRLRGIDTVQSIVSTYAPASDGNDVPAYIKNIDKELGVSATQHLNLGDARVLAELIRAVIKQEIGTSGAVSSGTISKAARDATAGSGPIIRIENNTGGSAIASVAALGSSR